MKIEVDAFQVTNYFSDRVAASARVLSSETWTNEEGEAVLGGANVNSPDFYRETPASALDGIVTIQPFEGDNAIDATEINAVHNGVTYELALYDTDGAYICTVLSNLIVSDLQTPTTWALIEAFSNSRKVHYSSTLPSWAQIVQYLGNFTALTSKATKFILGAIAVSQPPANALFPIAVGTNDTRVSKDLSLYNDSLSAAVAAIGSSAPTLLNITTDTTITNETIVMAANIKLNPLAKITLVNSTLGIRSMEKVGNRQIFSVDGSSQVLFAKGAVSEINTAWWTGMVTDADISKALTDSIAACAANGSGVIYIPEGRWVKSGVHNIPAATKVYGAGSFTDNVANQGTTIKLTSSNGSCFRIGEVTYSVELADVTLDGAGTTNSNGLLLQGAQPNTSGDLAINNVTFANFNVGVNLNSTFQTWQFAQISLRNCKFTYCTTSGLRCDSINTAWHLDTCNFYVRTTNAVALDLVAIGASIFENCEFAMLGTTYASTKCVTVSGAHGIIEFTGCQSEGCNVFLENNASDIESIINFNSCIIQGKIQSNQSCTINSSKGKYFAYTFQDATGVGAEITSDGDRCRNIDVANVATNTPTITDPNLVRLDKFVGGSKIKIQNNVQTGGNGAIYRVTHKVFSTELENGNPDIPLTSAGAYTNTSESKRLARWGRTTAAEVFDFFVDFIRDYNTGRFQWIPNQQGFAGFDFFAPVTANGLTIGLSQVESNTVVAASGITTSGNAKSIVTAAGLSGSPLTIPVPVTTAKETTDAKIAAAIEHALLANFAISSFFNVTRDGATLRLIKKNPAANDGTLNFTIQNDTCAGITNSASSTLEVSGIPGSRITSEASGTASLNFPSIAANTTAELTIAVAGAFLGSVAFASPSTTIESGLSWSAYVSATDVVTIRLANNTVGAIDPAAKSWTAWVRL